MWEWLWFWLWVIIWKYVKINKRKQLQFESHWDQPGLTLFVGLPLWKNPIRTCVCVNRMCVCVQDMEVSPKELMDILNKIVSKREWFLCFLQHIPTLFLSIFCWIKMQHNWADITDLLIQMEVWRLTASASSPAGAWWPSWTYPSTQSWFSANWVSSLAVASVTAAAIVVNVWVFSGCVLLWFLCLTFDPTAFRATAQGNWASTSSNTSGTTSRDGRWVHVSVTFIRKSQQTWTL